jgi:hypothetical protein
MDGQRSIYEAVIVVLLGFFIGIVADLILYFMV